MSVKIKSASDSQSSHAKNASMGNLMALHAAWSAIPKENRVRVIKASNLAGTESMSTFPAFMQGIIFNALTHDMGKVWGNHPFHSDIDGAMSLVSDKAVDVKTRMEYAAILLAHPDKAMGKLIERLLVAESGLPKSELDKLLSDKGKAIMAQRVKENAPKSQEEIVNAMPVDSLVKLLASKLGISESDLTALVDMGKVQPTSPVKAENAELLKAAKQPKVKA